METSTDILTVSDTLDIHPFPADPHNDFPRPATRPVSASDGAIRERLSDTARQDEKRRRLSEFLERTTPAWNPDDHPEIDAAGGAAAWVRKMRREAEEGFKRRTQNRDTE